MGKYSQTLTAKAKKKYAKYLSEEEQLKLITGYSPLYLRERFIIYLLLPGLVLIAVGLGWAYFGKVNLWVGGIVGLIPAVLLAVVLTYLVNLSHRFLLTTRRVILKEGFFNIRIASALYDKITHISVTQGFMDRTLLHHGTVVVDTAGSTGDELTLEYVEEPLEFKNVLENLIHQHHTKQGSESPLEKAGALGPHRRFLR